MAVEHNSQSFVTGKGILVFPDHYVAVGQLFEKNSPLATDVEGSKIVKAGTIFPSNDNKAIGIVFSDLDVTRGDQNGAVLIHAFIKKSALPVALSAEAQAVLPLIKLL